MDPQRIDQIEGEIKEIWREVDGLKQGQNALEMNMELMKKDMEYTRKAVDKIDGNVELLTKARFSDHYEEPIKAERTKKERRLSQVEGVIIGIVVAYILYAVFPILAK
ncbi:hypothetical protein KCG48_04885 [Proteiniclasticum sp. BAD-10]|uniref:Uncharacterized protein n=1 Tax=Proteiniclasticum sediminis TaxID=2804028 RepID=A0A941CN06_9CLOT|nr:hypothetical protein [Proteiniclasticum sediminis]MBR0575675.1 hypothetical protein [Proteiniclasticum sediminis]